MTVSTRTLLPVLVLLIAGALLPVSTAYACSCLMPSGPQESWAGADAVFAGEVTDVERVDRETSYPYLRVTFAVQASWKEVQSRTLAIRTSTNSAACGYGFRTGDTYLVYAYASEDGMLSTNSCTRTRPFAQAADDMLKLEDELLWTSDTLPVGGAKRCGGPFGAVAQTLFFTLGVAALGRRRQQRQTG